MKSEFSWYFSATEEEIDEIWKNGVLTVDANVLLDLYRYHESTRNSLLNSLENFNGKLWLSRQAAEEFFRNRTKVIISSEKTFKQATDEVETLRKNFESAVHQLKGNRIIPADVADILLKDVTPIIDNAQNEITKATSSYPNYLKNDPILDKVSRIFNGFIGENFKDDEMGSLKEEAEKRKANKIPPGYLDDDKDGDRPYGDFFLWTQILKHSKDDNTPMIFVTSERKDDWWEKISGKTTGPRRELLREFYEFSKQRVLIYQTDRFLEYASERAGKEVDNSAVEEIRAVDTLRAEKENAVEIVTQSLSLNSEYLQTGRLVLNLHRPVQNLTGSGHLQPRMSSPPDLRVTLVSSPQNIPTHRITSGAGTNYDFNVHIISQEYGILLPIGEYIFEYTATCEEFVTENKPKDDAENN